MISLAQKKLLALQEGIHVNSFHPVDMRLLFLET